MVVSTQLRAGYAAPTQMDKILQTIASDRGRFFLQIRQHMPDDLAGKYFVTNTPTSKNVEELKERKLHILVTVTPRLEGCSFGTNVMEATLFGFDGQARI